MRTHFDSSSVHSEWTWDSTPILARTSSLRLVSCVDRVTMADGQYLALTSAPWWNSAADTPKRSGSPPTSLSDTSRASR